MLMNRIKTHKKLLTILLFLLIFCALALIVYTHKVLWIDEEVYRHLIKLYSPNRTKFFIFSTSLWSTYMIIAVALLTSIIFLFSKKNRRFSIVSLLTPAIIYLINRWIKEIIQRPRPDILRLVQETDYSFPSGHTMESLAVYGLFAISLILLTKNKKIRTLIIILISIIIFLIITSRIYLGVHYFSDILWWLLLSWAYLLALSFFIKNEY